MAKKTLLEKLSDEYMKVTGKRRIFTSQNVARRAIQSAKIKVPTRKQSKTKKKPSTDARSYQVKVGKSTFKSLNKAFTDLKIPIKHYKKVLTPLKAGGKCSFEHGKKTYNFSLVK